MVLHSVHPDLLVFSQHLWFNLPQRSQDLLIRESHNRKIYLCEEPILGQAELPYLQVKEIANNISIVTPNLPKQIHPENVCAFMRDLIDNLIYTENMINYSLWYFDAMAVNFTDHLEPVSMQFVSLEAPPIEKKSQYSHFSALDFSMTGAY